SHKGDEEGDEAARSDLLAAVTNGLYALTREHQVILFLDDIQWIDESSASLLRHLRESFAPGSATSLIVVVGSRDPAAVEKLELDDHVFTLTPPSADEQIRILQRSLGIESGTARRLVEALGIMCEESGGMFWLI